MKHSVFARGVLPEEPKATETSRFLRLWPSGGMLSVEMHVFSHLGSPRATRICGTCSVFSSLASWRRLNLRKMIVGRTLDLALALWLILRSFKLQQS